MGCDISGEQLWSWIDRDASELEEHLAVCVKCRDRATRMREEIGLLSSEAAGDLPLPDKIGPYNINRLLGEGGQALVYDAEQPAPRRRVALKVLKGGVLVDKTRIKRFLRETQTLARLNHPSIATIFESGRSKEGHHYFAMELVEGRSLLSFVNKNKPEQQELLELFVRVCEAVHYAHEHGVIHRDLKPSNIMINDRGDPKILDFGLARLAHGDEFFSVTVTKEHRIEGTPRYMSPEQALGLVDKIDARSDVYSLGVILYEILTGEPPNDISLFTPAVVKAICEEIPQRPSSRNKSLHGDLDAILLKALEKEPERRYQTVAEMTADIRRYLDGEPVLAKAPGFFYITMRKLRKHRMPVFVAALSVAVVTVLVYIAVAPGDEVAVARANLLETRYLMIRDGATDALYQRALLARSRHRGFPEAILLRAQAYFLNRERIIAIRYLEPIVESDTSMWPYRILLEELESQPGAAGGSPTSVVWNSRLAASAEAWYMRSFATLYPRNAVEWAGEALAIDNEHVLARTFLVRMTGLSDQPEVALDASRKLVETGLADFNIIRLMITILTRMGRIDEALDECNQLVARLPDSASMLSMRARLRRQMRDYAGADEDITRAIVAIEANNRSGISNYGWLYYHRGTIRWLLGRIDEAVADYQATHDRLTYATYADARLYILLHDKGQPDRAEDLLLNAKIKGNTDPWLLEIFSCLEGESSPDALVASAEASADNMKKCEAYYYAGERYLMEGSTEQACLMFEKCVGTGVKYDPHNTLDSMSEYELAAWHLARLND